MSLLNRIKNRVGLFFLQRALRKQVRNRAFCNFDSAKTVGVLFDASHQESYMTTKAFIASLQQKRIDAKGLGYVATQEALEYFPAHENIQFFSLKANNWYFKPISNEAIDFITKKIDILIYLTMLDALQLKFIVGLADAKLKLGSRSTDLFYYDFIIDMKGKDNLRFYIGQVNHYLSTVKSA